MRTNSTLLSFLFPAAVLLNGCLEYEITTTVRSNGSLTRTVNVRGDSTSLHRWDLAIAVDSTWASTLRKVDDRKWQLVAKRDFASTDAWAAYQNADRIRGLRFHLRFEKQFDWFRTRYLYTERLECFNPFRAVPITNFLSEAQQQRFFELDKVKDRQLSGPDSATYAETERLFDEWQKRSEFESYFLALRSTAEKAHTMPVAILDSLKEGLYRSYLSVTVRKDGGFDHVSEKSLEQLLKAVRVKGWKETVDASVDRLAHLIEDSKFVEKILSDTYTNSVVMPGMMAASNGKIVDGLSARWEDYLAQGYIGDFTMRAESVDWNWWMVGLAAVIVAGGPATWIARNVMRHRRGY